MKSPMRLAFEAAKVNTSTDPKLVKKVLRVMERQDAAAQRKRVRKAHPVSKVREQ